MTYAFAAAAQPGVFQTYLISQSVSYGFRRTLPAAFSPLLSDVPVIAIVLLVLSRVPPRMTQALRCAGGVFVLYLAWCGIRSYRNWKPGELAHAPSKRQSVLRGAMVNLLNPNPYIAWSLVLGPLLLKGWREAPARGIALLAGFYTVLILASAGIIGLAASARGLGPGVTRALIGISAAALGCFGCYLLWTAGS